MFQLNKWYLDLVADDGTAFVGYLARLRWGAIRVSWASTLHGLSGSPPVEAVSLGNQGTIGVEDGVGSWHDPALGVEGRWEGTAPPVHQTLWQEPGGVIDWSGLLPSARAVVQLGSTRLEGHGYVEHLTLTLRPWQLPFDTLQWGRYATAQHAVTWIGWEGKTLRQWIWLNGGLCPDARLTPDGVAGLPDGITLQLGTPRDLRQRRVLDTITAHLPAVASRLGERLSSLQEHKKVSPTALLQHGQVVDRGWAIHEEVRW